MGGFGGSRRTRESAHPIEPVLGERDFFLQLSLVRHPSRLSKLDFYFLNDARAVLAWKPRSSLEDVPIQQQRRGAHWCFQ